MKKTITLFVVLFGSILNFASAQNSNLDYRFALKIYNQSSYERVRFAHFSEEPISNYNFNSQNIQILHPTIALQWSNDISKFHEIELTNFSFGSNTTTSFMRNKGTDEEETLRQLDVNSTNIALRYEYIRTFRKQNDAKLVPSFGGSLNPYFTQHNYSSQLSGNHPVSTTTVGIAVYLIPRLTYFINSKVFIDLNLPICSHNTYMLFIQEENPQVPTTQRKTQQYNFDQFPGIFSGRLGIGLKI